LNFLAASALSTVDTSGGTAPAAPALTRQPTIRRSHPMKGALAWLIGIPIPIIIILYLLGVF
jgi:hypothetical protein